MSKSIKRSKNGSGASNKKQGSVRETIPYEGKEAQKSPAIGLKIENSDIPVVDGGNDPAVVGVDSNGKKMNNPNIMKQGKHFSSTYQPKRSTGTKFLTEMLRNQLQLRKQIQVEGIDPLTGKKIKILITNPTIEIIIATLLRNAANGNMKAIEMVWDRLEGKPDQKYIMKDGDDDDGKDHNVKRMIELSDGTKIPFVE